MEYIYWDRRLTGISQSKLTGISWSRLTGISQSIYTGTSWSWLTGISWWMLHLWLMQVGSTPWPHFSKPSSWWPRWVEEALNKNHVLPFNQIKFSPLFHSPASQILLHQKDKTSLGPLLEARTTTAGSSWLSSVTGKLPGLMTCGRFEMGHDAIQLWLYHQNSRVANLFLVW